MDLAIVGAGYVGLVTGACLADFGHTVTCVDVDPAKIDALRNGRVPIYEPGLDQLIESNRAAKRLFFTTNLATAVARSRAVFIAVGTPARRGDGHADVSYVHAAAREIAQSMDGHTVVINKSTVPVGTGDEVAEIIRGIRPDAEFAVVSNPEFLREGAAIEDFKRPNRIVIGANDDEARAVMSEIYRPLFLNQSPILFSDLRTAELTKYAANAFLATKITFINEIADLCEAVGADVQDLARGIGLDQRIGTKFLHPGPGYGGSCFPKDTAALLRTADEHGVSLRIVNTVSATNSARKRAMAGRIIDALGGPTRGKTVAILGLTFKPNTDDMREAPSLDIIAALSEAGVTVRAFDPIGIGTARALMPSVTYCGDAYDCATGADVLAIVTEWEEFRALDLAELKARLRRPVIVDLRNVYRSEEMVAAGFIYRSIGRGSEGVMIRGDTLASREPMHGASILADQSADGQRG
jgi:UDPglucose 6-dehydrogenase